MKKKERCTQVIYYSQIHTYTHTQIADRRQLSRQMDGLQRDKWQVDRYRQVGRQTVDRLYILSKQTIYR